MHRKCQSFFSPPAGGRTRKRCWLTLSFNNSQVFMTVSINENKPFAHSDRTGRALLHCVCQKCLGQLVYMSFVLGSVFSEDILKQNKKKKKNYTSSIAALGNDTNSTEQENRSRTRISFHYRLENASYALLLYSTAKQESGQIQRPRDLVKVLSSPSCALPSSSNSELCQYHHSGFYRARRTCYWCLHLGSKYHKQVQHKTMYKIFEEKI